MNVYRRAGSLAALLVSCAPAWAASPVGPAGEPALMVEINEQVDAVRGAVSDGNLDAGRALLEGLFENLLGKKAASAPKFLKTGGGGCDEWGGATGCPPNLPDLRMPRREPERREPERREPERRPEPPVQREPPLQKPPTERPTPPQRREPPPPTRRDA